MIAGNNPVDGNGMDDRALIARITRSQERK